MASVQATPILLRNALLFDGVSDELREGDVLVEQDRIKEVSDSPLKCASAREFDLAGRTLLPGLIDAHFHACGTDLDLAKAAALPPSLQALEAHVLLERALQRGFTSVRDAGGADLGLALAVERGLIEGPRIFHSGKALTQTGGHGDLRGPTVFDPCGCAQRANSLSAVVDGVDEMRKAVREELRKGATQIKLFLSGGISSPSDPVRMPQFCEDEIKVAVEEAATRGTYVMAHAYTAESILRGIACGIRSFEHGNLIDRAAAEAVAAAGAFVVPTLVTYEANHRWGRSAGAPAFLIEKLEEVRSAGLAACEILASAGVKTGFGTDLLGPLHDHQSEEFLIRREVMSPLEILRSATSVNAALLQREGELGTVAVGALADLIVIDGNPLEDIALLAGQGESIPLIMKDGRLMKQELD